MTKTQLRPSHVNFKIFTALWNKYQGQTTPQIHFKMADWLEKSWETKHTRLLLQAFRSSGKSTITGLYAAWLLYRNPALRILVLAADSSLARKMVRNVKRIIERHPLTFSLIPTKADQWGADRFTVNRHLELRDPSMLARGISANITGNRADIIICDDVEVPKTCATAAKRADLREKLTETAFILTTGGTLLYVGTPHSWFTIYADQPRQEIGEEKVFLEDYHRLTIPVLNSKNQSVWPERFSLSDITKMQKTGGPAKFKSQMLLKPVNITEGRLDPNNLRFYDQDLQKVKELNALFIGDKRIVSASAWWDPAFGKSGGDSSVIAVIFTDEQGFYWLHRIVYLQTDNSSLNTEGTQQDEATQQCLQIIALAKELYLPSIAIETNGIGKFLPAILRKELNKARIPCAVLEMHSTRPKDIRIMESFDVVLAARALYAHQSIKQTFFLTEMQEWQPGLKGQHDDGLDAVAGALSLEPVRLRQGYIRGPNKPNNWHKASQTHKADTQFDI